MEKIDRLREHNPGLAIFGCSDPKGFRALIILPEMTNAPFEGGILKPGDDAMLFAVNKWMLAHPESPQAGRGALVGITGTNIEVRT